MNPNFKVTITHCGETTNYTGTVFNHINVRRRENNYDVATLILKDPNSYYYTFKLAKFDDIKIYFKYSTQTTYTQVFGGTIREANPSLANGKYLTLNCKGYGAAFEETNCNRDYGIESSNPSYPRAWNIWTNIADDFVEKSFDGAATGHVLDHTLITDTYATDIKYLNNPYRTNLEVANIVCNLTSAIGAGTTAGAHWIVDPEAYFMVAKIGDHTAGAGSPEARWPDWWNYLEADSTLSEGRDFTGFSVLDKTEEYANHILLLTDFRRPAYDYYTEGAVANSLWTNDGLSSITDDADCVVGADSVKFYTGAGAGGGGWGYMSFPSATDVTKWGSVKTIPRLNFYCKKHALTTATTVMNLNTVRKADYFSATFLNWATESDDKWLFKSLPIGPYWDAADETREIRWTANGSADWANLTSIEFQTAGAGAGGYLLLDDLHFNGKIIRSAKDTSEIARVKEYQKVLIARNSMDDSCIASDDSGYAGRIAYAELLRRTALPLTPTFTLKHGKPQMMPGQKATVQLCKHKNGTYQIDQTMRLLTVEHNIDASGFTTTVTATTDLLNSFPMSVPDQYAMWMENMFLNSSEAKSIRAGAEVDLLIPMLSKSY